MGFPKHNLALAATLALLPAAVAACGGTGDAAGPAGGGEAAGKVDLVAYSTPQAVYEEDLIPAFQATPEGNGVEFSASFGSSGDQSRAVEAGQPADLVHLPIEPDITRLVDAGLVAPDYAETEQNGGVVQTSVVAFGVRPGNPKDIHGWEDLVRDDVQVVTPNPFTSGGARWNIMAAYGHVVENGGTEEEALAFVKRVLENTVVQDASARDSLNTFLGGQGDVVISYENEILGARQAGEDLDLVVPDETIRIDTIAVVPKDASPQARDFLDFLFSRKAQRIWAENGYRPVDREVLSEFEDEFPEPRRLFGIADFGGWDEVAPALFDPENGKIAAIERQLGVATG